MTNFYPVIIDIFHSVLYDINILIISRKVK